MALKAGYYGLKRSLLNKVKALPGIKSIGTGLSLNSTTGELEATGATISIEANPEGEATENLIKLGLGDNVYAIPDAAKTYQTDDTTESAIVDADYIPFLDSSAASGSGAPKKSTWTNFISKIKAKITEYVTWEANNILGAKNLLPNLSASTGIFTVNSDGTVTADGTPTTDSARFDMLSDVLPVGNYIYTGCPAGGADDSYRCIVRLDNSEGTSLGYDTGNGRAFELTEPHKIFVRIFIPQNFEADDMLFKPMIRLATDTDNTYVPYAMTNSELTDQVNTVLSISSNSDLSKLKEGFNAVKFASGLVIGTTGGNITLTNNCRGYIVRNGSVINGLIMDFDMSNIYFIDSDDILSIKFAYGLVRS